MDIGIYTKLIRWTLAFIQNLLDGHWYLYKTYWMDIGIYTKLIRWTLVFIQNLLDGYW
jgi:hypothetical protein